MAYEITWDKSPRNCPICGTEFVRKGNQKYCSPKCLTKAYKVNWDKSPRNCPICGTEFVPRRGNQKYCNPKCTNIASQQHYERIKSIWDKSPRNCLFCGTEFLPTATNQQYCCFECRKECNKRRAKKNYYLKTKNGRRIIEGKPSYTNFNNLLFWSEKEFEKWFKNNYAIFGLKTLH